VNFENAYDSVTCFFGGIWWEGWMKPCLFGGHMPILVNGSSMKDINAQRGLMQGDPLAPFLFLLVAEGFIGLMTNAVNCNLFNGFEIKRGGVVISYLQYVDDTLWRRGWKWIFTKVPWLGYRGGSGLKILVGQIFFVKFK